MIAIEIIDPSRVIGMDFGRTIRRGVKSVAEEMRDKELAKVIDRTPWFSGALQLDEQGTFNKNTDDDEIIQLTVGTQNQMAAMSIVDGTPGNRIYAQYVEFGSPGNQFNPMDGYHMFGQAETEDIPLIEEIGAKGVQNGADDTWQGRGYRL